MVPFGSSFTAKVQSTNSQYNAGSMTSVSSGIITEKNINLTASPAAIAIPTGSMTINSRGTYNVPAGINRIKVTGISASGTITHYFNVSGSFTVTVKEHTRAVLCIQNVVVGAGGRKSITVYWGPDINNK